MTTDEIRAEATQRVCIALAGRIAERRIKSATPSQDGFMRFSPIGEALAFHEAGHAVIALAYEWRLISATIIADKSIAVGRFGSRYSVGHVKSMPKRQTLREHDPNEPPQRTWTDHERISRFAILLADEVTWRSALRLIRKLRAETEQLVETFWPEIAALAGELLTKKTVSGPEMEAIMWRWPARAISGEATPV
jgi:hypothetical protein